MLYKPRNPTIWLLTQYAFDSRKGRRRYPPRAWIGIDEMLNLCVLILLITVGVARQAFDRSRAVALLQASNTLGAGLRDRFGLSLFKSQP